jgi:penicillin-binding protein 2
MNAFGLGHRLGVDLPSERSGKIPIPSDYDKVYGHGHWNFCTFRSVSIGQGEVLTTPLQVANEMAYLANKGWFITPHIVDSISGGDRFGLLERFKIKHIPIDIPDTTFEVVHNGMQGVVESGTGTGAKIPGIIICGKTGTAENYYKGVKQKDHSFFAAFAPRQNPRIAIMVICENAGFGGTWAAPIASLMIEKYLNDTIAANRKPLEDRMIKANLIPSRMLREMRTMDSLQQVKEAESVLKNDLKDVKDTLQSDDNLTDEEIRAVKTKSNTPSKDSQEKQPVKKDIITPGKQRQPSLNKKDTVQK